MENKKKRKTREKIYQGFASLLKQKDYEEITAKEIIVASGVSRSSFYAHFSEKGDLLVQFADHFFNHVFSSGLEKEETHDFSHAMIFDYPHLIVHFFYHVRDEKDLLDSIYHNEGAKQRFFPLLGKGFERIEEVIPQFTSQYNDAIPDPLKKRLFASDMLLLIEYWMNSGYEESPERLADYFFHVRKR